MRLFRGGRRPARAVVALLAAGAVLAACSDGTVQSQADGKGGGIGGAQQAPKEKPRPMDVELVTSDPRASGGVVAAGDQDAVYNYSPTVMRDGGKLKMWWCSQYGSAQPPGDDVLYAQSPSLDGPFTGPSGGGPAAVFSGAPGGFDGMHTCDPSVIKVGSTYYMYYTGAAGDHALGNSIGLATSSDGLTWTRAAGGKPIIGPSHDVHRDNVYGAGQPSAVYLDGWFYVLFTDTTAKGAGWNGAGQFLLRARDAAFTRNVETLGEQGFVAKPGTTSPRPRSLVDAFSTDLMWVGSLDAFVIAHETEKGTTLTFWNRDFTAQPYRPALIPGAWKEGPGLVRRPDGHAPLSSGDVCDRVPFDVVRATVIGGAAAPTDLKHFGLDVRGSGACENDARIRTAFEGVAMPSPQRTIDLVAGGTLVRVDRRSVAAALAGEVLNQRLTAVDNLPRTARLSAGARMVHAPGRGFGVVLDGKLFALPDGRTAVLNDSAVETIADQAWDGFPAGFSLAG
ncbi:beta-xylosidase [Amycolatopsis roodepoortensis]|uniref:beta-xylosidase n=1 Tax=Amycolatopsis roodepoortensis TaxID=700274 RepID=UPI00214A961C|nr:beta-xylosidase [Amycolatopsis roodepoortensis]UUV33466.1 beta-xylosidase [Amycolatopsis roodepoortensis]